MAFITVIKYFSNAQFSDINLITKDGKIIIQSSILYLLWPDVGELAMEHAYVSENVSVVIPDVTIEDVENAIGKIIEACKSKPLEPFFGTQIRPLESVSKYKQVPSRKPEEPNMKLEDGMKDFIKGLPIKVVFEEVDITETETSLNKEQRTYEEKNPVEKVVTVEEVKDKEGSCEEKGESTEKQVQPIVCEDCGKTFGNVQRLKIHTNAVHLGISLACPECDFATAYGKSRLKEHMYNKHRKEGDESMLKYQCHTCGKKYVNKTLLKEHEFSHNPKDIKCELCDKTFFSLYHMKRHMKDVHSEQNIPCDVCCKMFKTKASLKEHYNSLHVSDSERKYKCEKCGQGFHKLIAFRDHSNKHLGLTPYSCPSEECDKKNADNTSLHHHKKVCSHIRGVTICTFATDFSRNRLKAPM